MNETNFFVEMAKYLSRATSIIYPAAKCKYKPLELDKAFTAYTVQKKKDETFGAYIDRMKKKGYTIL